MKVLVKVVVLALMVISVLSPNVASATSKEALQIKQEYKAFKFGMTLTEVAKMIYGKEYRKYIKNQKGRVVFTKKPARP
ncbi:hypothetical protein OVA29_02855 [Exiguobacterium sp. SL14]|nr:hypothetical protein [Exiguobacterium sp. SL14]MCY1689878.1 hypothetical protein [Exiguobacterium sp. SL14]